MKKVSKHVPNKLTTPTCSSNSSKPRKKGSCVLSNSWNHRSIHSNSTMTCSHSDLMLVRRTRLMLHHERNHCWSSSKMSIQYSKSENHRLNRKCRRILLWSNRSMGWSKRGIRCESRLKWLRISCVTKKVKSNSSNKPNSKRNNTYIKKSKNSKKKTWYLTKSYRWKSNKMTETRAWAKTCNVHETRLHKSSNEKKPASTRCSSFRATTMSCETKSNKLTITYRVKIRIWNKLSETLRCTETSCLTLRLRWNPVVTPSCNCNQACRMPTHRCRAISSSSLTCRSSSPWISSHPSHPCSSTCRSSRTFHLSNHSNHHLSSHSRRVTTQLSTHLSCRHLRDQAMTLQTIAVRIGSSHLANHRHRHSIIARAIMHRSLITTSDQSSMNHLGHRPAGRTRLTTTPHQSEACWPGKTRVNDLAWVVRVVPSSRNSKSFMTRSQLRKLMALHLSSAKCMAMVKRILSMAKVGEKHYPVKRRILTIRTISNKLRLSYSTCKLRKTR